jgi:hypothetical protein
MALLLSSPFISATADPDSSADRKLEECNQSELDPITISVCLDPVDP